MSQRPPKERPGLGESLAEAAVVVFIGMFALKILPWAIPFLLLAGLVSCVF